MSAPRHRPSVRAGGKSMTMSDEKSTTIRNIARFTLIGAACLCLTYASLVLWAVSRLLWAHTPIDASVLKQDPLDADYLIVMALIGGGLGLEWLVNGWQRCPLRRVLFED